MSEMDEVIQDFLVESYEALEQIDQELIVLEEGSASSDSLASIFRSVHTIKGTCGFLGFKNLESVSHVGENLLSALRDGELTMTTAIADGLLALVDALREMLAIIETAGNDGDRAYEELVELLKDLLEPSAERGTDSPDPADSDSVSPEPACEEQAEVSSAEAKQTEDSTSSAPVASVEEKADAAPATSAMGGSLRVDVGLLDCLMNLVGELVLARNEIIQFTGTHEDTCLHAASQRLDLITTELQEGVMQTRMQPIGNIWGRFPRLVRDLAHSCDRNVKLQMDGKETELDKTLIEAIKDPLTHLVRNAIDHGLESPDVRKEAGKPEVGTLQLLAYHEGGQVIIEINDDGAGIDANALREKALAQGLIRPEAAAQLTDHDLYRLIFEPGLSTAKQVSNVSGRGVGMDVVRTNIERIGGTIDLQSERGVGTSVKVKIPLTLAIIPALVVTTSDEERYAIPQVSLLELLRLDSTEAQGRIETIHGAPVYRLRGKLLPLITLDHELGLPPKAAADGEDERAINIVILQADEQPFGLVVDRIWDTVEIVVKPLSPQLKDVTAFAGATIMGNGEVALILDVLSIAQRAGVVGGARGGGAADDRTQDAVTNQRSAALLFSLGSDSRLAVPLSDLARLEEFPQAEFEWTGSEEVVQYRGEIMRLLRLSEILPERRSCSRPSDASTRADAERIPVIVYTTDQGVVGLVVHEIIDIIEESLSIQRRPTRKGVLGSVVIDGRVTEVLDIDTVIEMAGVFPSIDAPVLQGVE